MADFFNGVISGVKEGLGTVGTFFLLLCLSLAFGVAFFAEKKERRCCLSLMFDL